MNHSYPTRRYADLQEWRDRHSGPDPERAYALRPVDLVRREGDEVAKRSVHRELSIGLRRIDMDERDHITRQRRTRPNRLDDSDLCVELNARTQHGFGRACTPRRFTFQIGRAPGWERGNHTG